MSALEAQQLDKPAYRLFDSNGQESNYAALLKEAVKADVVLFGELHNNPICHWLQIELAQDLHQARENALVLGGEMFEADDQLALNEYLTGLLSDANFESETKIWTNYKTDYKPLIAFAAQKQLPFIATNIPRRYASMVSRSGLEVLEKLPSEVRQWIAPLPIVVDLSLPGYAQMMEMMQGHGGGMKAANFAQAQAIKDATMAHRILANWHKDKTFLHFNGAYHSDNHEGIVWYLRKQAPKLKILTISTVEQASIQTLQEDAKQKADFIIATPNTMTKTY
ncbi:ChaN family lipoprotein [Eisenibacter elegans]|jgi:uncharacterized iron-regulated protein|uniref:ChaN family lipoprotein n=1 Tax=Eisenibacter elegans TaxID=997 RepID=UPI0003F6CB41|nr:ChaN family lipoprotein [Eisenibacter elegans]